MPYQDMEGGHRIALNEVLSHAREVFENGYQLEAILLAHEYLEQRLNVLYKSKAPANDHTMHRKFKNLIEVLSSSDILADEDYEVLNEFNRLRNVNSNLILNPLLTLRGAKKGDMARAMDLADQSDRIISRLTETSKSRKKRKNS